ncbi:hypothetical protein A2U01_0095407 [Trifolium medium]|uniref:Uncharacterized protein n=1 Tax=Trifolium medium TaxID=97028 RepID=A0A392UKI3_9FABA|nr:hypothetical protein [Trifolium medium]
MATRRRLFARLRSRNALVVKTFSYEETFVVGFLLVVYGCAKLEEESSL